MREITVSLTDEEAAKIYLLSRSFNSSTRVVVLCAVQKFIKANFLRISKQEEKENKKTVTPPPMKTFLSKGKQ